jgi:hypothetical protein
VTSSTWYSRKASQICIHVNFHRWLGSSLSLLVDRPALDCRTEAQGKSIPRTRKNRKKRDCHVV